MRRRKSPTITDARRDKRSAPVRPKRAPGKAAWHHLVHGFASPSLTAAGGPIILDRARGVFVWDVHGRRYLDGLSSLWNVSIGHGRAEIGRRIASQIRQLSYAPTLLGFSSEPAMRLATRLVRMAPKGLTRVVFTSGGSEANETVIRLARLYWRLRGKQQKFKMIALERAYHGSTTGAATLTGLPYFHQHFGPLLPGVVRMANAYCYRCPLKLTYPGCGVACADELERVLEREGPETVAAFIAEPVQGVGGVIVPPPGYFERIRAICDRHDVLMVVDEVITGFGRLGKRFGIERWKAVPDMISFAKGVTSGYQPLGGVIFAERIYKAMEDAGPGFSLHHGFTYSGHPVVCAAALANLDIMEKEKLFAGARAKARHFEKRLSAMRDLPLVGDVRTAGLMGALEIVADKGTKAPFPADVQATALIREAAMRRGLIVRGSGDNVVVCPPLIIEREQIDFIAATLADSIREVAPTLPAA